MKKVFVFSAFIPFFLMASQAGAEPFFKHVPMPHHGAEHVVLNHLGAGAVVTPPSEVVKDNVVDAIPHVDGLENELHHLGNIVNHPTLKTARRLCGMAVDLTKSQGAPIDDVAYSTLRAECAKGNLQHVWKSMGGDEIDKLNGYTVSRARTVSHSVVRNISAWEAHALIHNNVVLKGAK